MSNKYDTSALIGIFFEHMHDNFFVFLNMETEAINVVYKRKNGTYGLIEPETK